MVHDEQQTEEGTMIPNRDANQREKLMRKTKAELVAFVQILESALAVLEEREKEADVAARKVEAREKDVRAEFAKYRHDQRNAFSEERRFWMTTVKTKKDLIARMSMEIASAYMDCELLARERKYS